MKKQKFRKIKWLVQDTKLLSDNNGLRKKFWFLTHAFPTRSFQMNEVNSRGLGTFNLHYCLNYQRFTYFFLHACEYELRMELLHKRLSWLNNAKQSTTTPNQEGKTLKFDLIVFLSSLVFIILPSKYITGLLQDLITINCNHPWEQVLYNAF